MNKKKKITRNLLEGTLVPKDDQPYELPPNWVWVFLEGVCEKIIDGTHHSPKSYSEGDYKYITAKNIKEDGITLDNVTYVTKEVHKEIYTRCNVKKNDVLYIKDGATTGIATVNHLEEEFSLLSSVGLLRVRENILLPHYLKYCLNSPSTRGRMLGMMSGNAIRRLTLKKIKQGIIPLPPIGEQKCIVDKTERLLNKIDETKQLIGEAKKTFELRRASILNKAFRGELTKKWRQENSLEEISGTNEQNETLYKIPEEWRWITLGEIATFVGSGSTPKGGSKVYQKHGVPFIRSQNVLRNKMNIEDVAYISEDIHASMKRTQMHGNETLLNITGASIGRATKLSNELVPSNINQHVCALRFKDDINEYLPQYWLNSPYLQKKINEMQVGVTRQALNFSQVKSLPFPLIPFEEQKELLKIIESLLAKEDKLTLIDEINIKMDILKQTILTKAFRGELGTNDPTEENAIELLKEVLQEQVK